MSATLDRVIEHTQALLRDAETQVMDSATSSNHPSGVAESRIASGLTQRDFGNTRAHTFNSGRQPESFSFTAFMDRFDGLRIPASPLHDY